MREQFTNLCHVARIRQHSHSRPAETRSLDSADSDCIETTRVQDSYYRPPYKPTGSSNKYTHYSVWEEKLATLLKKFLRCRIVVGTTNV